jgi:DNA-binding Lrp family transcriptional regulator
MADSDSDLYSRVLREMYSPAWLRKSGRESYAELAKSLGVDDQTVRNTIRRMRESGFLKTWMAFLNPHVLGRECESVLVKAEASSPYSKEKILTQLKLVEGVVAIFSFLGDPGFRVILYYEDTEALERSLRLIYSVCGVSEPSQSWKIPFPPCTVKLKKTDWELLRFLVKDPRKTISEIARGTGCPPAPFDDAWRS